MTVVVPSGKVSPELCVLFSVPSPSQSVGFGSSQVAMAAHSPIFVPTVTSAGHSNVVFPLDVMMHLIWPPMNLLFPILFCLNLR